jgi:NADH-quinone oxidoreductase subunit G/NADP-reducing hydrogenase subunit HndD
MMTSCSPGWINFIQTNYPEMLPHLSTAKSPQQMFGATVKTYYAEKAGVDPSKIVSVSVMPCTAKKWEASMPKFNDSGYRDVDIVVTTRELARMIKSMGIDFNDLPEEDFDDPMGISTGAGQLFGATGGVMEAALRTAYEVYTGKTLEAIDFRAVRGLEGIKEASVDLGGGVILKVAVAHTLRNARKLVEKMKAGEADYHFIEIMACPGGCLGGGGQPYPIDDEVRQARMDAIYNADEHMKLRKSHENPAIKELYDTWMGKPLGERAHHLLHTHYAAMEDRLK